MSVRAMIAAVVLGLAACGGAQPADESTTGAVAPGPGPGGTTPPGGGTGSGTLSGSVGFVGTPCAQPSAPPCDGPYPDYEVVVYAADGTTEVARTTTGADGTFSIDLPAGNYAIFTQAGLRPTDRARTDVVVNRDALTRTELRVDTGVR